MKKCPDCGMVIANQAIRCPKCKFDFSDGSGNIITTSPAAGSASGAAPSSGKRDVSIMPMSEINKDNVDEIYETLKSSIIKRKTEFDHFIDFLENRTSWLTSPADVEGPLAIEKGLLIRSVGVAKQLLRLKDTLMPQLDEESAIIMALFHDVGKVGVEGKPLFLVEEHLATSALGISISSRVTSAATKFTINDKLVRMHVGVRSLFLVSQYMLLSDDEAQAISYAAETELLNGGVCPHTLILETAIKMQKGIYEKSDVVSGYSFTVI